MPTASDTDALFIANLAAARIMCTINTEQSTHLRFTVKTMKFEVMGHSKLRSGASLAPRRGALCGRNGVTTGVACPEVWEVYLRPQEAATVTAAVKRLTHPV